MVALNIPSYITSRIRVGGIENLSDEDRSYLPKEIDTQNAAHRDYVEKAFNQHQFNGNVRFDDFYMAQCVWDEVMAESVAANLGTKKIVVLAGNGHIQYKYGIPDRAFRRTGIAFRTIYQASVGDEIELSVADYIWVTPANWFPHIHNPKSSLEPQNGAAYRLTYWVYLIFVLNWLFL